MSNLKDYLFNADLGVRRHGDALHVGVALAEALVTAAKMFKLVTPTVTAAGFTTVGIGTVATGGLIVATPVLGLVGAFLALGSGIHAAREEIENEAVLSGFSRGFICGLLNMSPTTVKSLFAQHGLGQRNPMDPGSDPLEMRSYNKGVVAGYAMGSQPSSQDKKAFLFEIKPFTGNLGGGAWGDREKIDYVVTYAANLRLHFLKQ